VLIFYRAGMGVSCSTDRKSYELLTSASDNLADYTILR